VRYKRIIGNIIIVGRKTNNATTKTTNLRTARNRTYSRAFESGTTRGAMRSAALARCHITAEHNVLSYRYTNPEPSDFFLARTSFPPPSHRITSTAPLRFLYSPRPPPSSSSYRFLRSPSHRCITPPPLELAKINQIRCRSARVFQRRRAIIFCCVRFNDNII
jgi:hypothetical protein